MKDRLKKNIKRLLVLVGMGEAAARLRRKAARYAPARVAARLRMKTFYGALIRPNDLCFDVGANFGNRTALFLELGARVVAIEPQEQCFESLKRKFGASPEVALVRKGAGAAPGTAELAVVSDVSTIATLSSDWQTKSRFASDYQWDKKETIEITTLDALIKEHGAPAFCKIDVEGFEEEVIKGLFQPLPILSFEYTSEFSETAERIIRRLSTLGFARFRFSQGETFVWTTPPVSAEEFIGLMREQGAKWSQGDIYAFA